MINHSCSLWIIVARTDVAFMMHTIPHLVRMCKYPFKERVLAVDTSMPKHEKRQRPDIGTLSDLRDNCNRLINEGITDRVIDIDFSDEYRRRIYKKHFGTSRLKETHNYKGAPYLGYSFCIEESQTEYILHFDCDMLLYQQYGFSWVEKGIDILEKYPEVMWVRPSAGPQTERLNPYRDKNNLKKYSNGFYRLEGFASRCFLLNKKHFENIFPIKILWAKKQGRKKDKMPRKAIEYFNYFTGSGQLESWEITVGARMKEKSFVRADIVNNSTWTLHPPDHGKDFIRILPQIIEKIEKGNFPLEQAGEYDLKLAYWMKFLNK